jgi:hypothetical protein
VTAWLGAVPPWVLAAYAIVASFSTYFCMYAFRKPFGAAQFEDVSFWDTDIELKTALGISQILGYTLSKFIGIKVCSEVQRRHRVVSLIGVILLAQAALLLFAVVPNNWKAAAMFLNGLPLGMVWGITVRYLEGRRTSELLLAGLSCSFIVSSAIVKQVGLWVMSEYEVSEAWMPCMVGLLFLPGFVVSVWLLDRIPPPDQQDEAERSHRESMGQQQRVAFFRHYLAGMVLLLITYFFLTAHREYRDQFSIEMLTEFGIADAKAVFVQIDLPVGLGVMAALAALNFVRGSRLGLIAVHGLMTLGTAMLLLGTWLLDQGHIDGKWWMILTGLGVYLAYVPYGSVLFDRIVASSRMTATAAFAIYVCDAVGYIGAVGIQLYKDLVASDASRLDFFRGYTYFVGVVAAVALFASCIYFVRRANPNAERA